MLRAPKVGAVLEDTQQLSRGQPTGGRRGVPTPPGHHDADVRRVGKRLKELCAWVDDQRLAECHRLSVKQARVWYRPGAQVNAAHAEKQ
eukprot:scaffold115381_cov31-Tisochrysis_lutea.AAC.2